MWVDVPNGGQASIGFTCRADRFAFARCAVVCTFSELELPDSRAAILVGFVIFCHGPSARRRNAIAASSGETSALAIAHSISHERPYDCYLSVRSEADEGHPRPSDT